MFTGSRDIDLDDRSPARFDKTYNKRRERDYYEDEEGNNFHQPTCLLSMFVVLSITDHFYSTEEFPKISLPLQDLEAALKDLETHQTIKPSKSELRSKSLPRPAKAKAEYGPRRDYDDQRHYEDDTQNFYDMHDLHDIDFENYREKKALEKEKDDYGNRDRGYDPEDDDFEFDSPRSVRQRRDYRYAVITPYICLFMI